MDRNPSLHYHIRWSDRAELDWECFDTLAEAQASANQLVRREETYTIEEQDQQCLRCRDAMKAKSVHSTSA